MWTNGSFLHVVYGYIKVTIKSGSKMHMITTSAHNHHEKKTKEILYELECKKKDKKKCLS